MVKPKIISEIPISISELKQEVAKIKKRDAELNFRVGRTEEYVNIFETPEEKEAELIKKIEELNIARLKREQIIKIADLAPRHLEELKTIMQGYTVTMSEDNLKKIIDIIKEIVG
jgi:DNA-directed RNA polymerase subunit F